MSLKDKVADKIFKQMRGMSEPEKAEILQKIYEKHKDRDDIDALLFEFKLRINYAKDFTPKKKK